MVLLTKTQGHNMHNIMVLNNIKFQISESDSEYWFTTQEPVDHSEMNKIFQDHDIKPKFIDPGHGVFSLYDHENIHFRKIVQDHLN